MNTCGSGHEDIAYNSRKCPVCNLQDDLDNCGKEIEDLKEKIDSMKDTINDLENKVNSSI